LTRYRLDISYDGTLFYGSQRQKSSRTVQAVVEKALSKIFKRPIEAVFSGRTDTKVHALNQVIHFDAPFAIDADSLLLALNRLLDKDVRGSRVSEVPSTFHARYSAISRTYQYHFTDDNLPVFLRDYVTFVPFKIIETHLTELCEMFVGTKDFGVVGSLGSNQSTSVRTIMELKIDKKEIKSPFAPHEISTFVLTITANSFLYHMVRNIVGIFFEVIKGRLSLCEVKGMIEKNEKLNYTTAKANGLYLVAVNF